MIVVKREVPNAMYDRLYIEFLYHFNVTQDYFECHEVMEAYWLNEGRNKKLQAFLQVAVALYHFRNDNRSGAIKLLEGALEKADTDWEGKTGIDEMDLFQKSREYLERLLEDEEKGQNHFLFSPFYVKITDPTLEDKVRKCVPLGVEGEA